MASISCSDTAHYSDAQLPVPGNSGVNPEPIDSGVNGFENYRPWGDQAVKGSVNEFLPKFARFNPSVTAERVIRVWYPGEDG